MTNFVSKYEDDSEHGIFTGKESRQATLKAANKSKGTKSKPEIIVLENMGQNFSLAIDLLVCLRISSTRWHFRIRSESVEVLQSYLLVRKGRPYRHSIL
jgi:hypothetical protein